MLGKIVELVKQQKWVVTIYEELWLFRCYVVAKFEYLKSILYLSSEEKRKIQTLKGIHKGKRCFIVGTGPSLLLEDLELIKNEISFTVNSGCLAYEKTAWRADYFVAMDGAAQIFFDKICEKNMPVCLVSRYINYKNNENVIKLPIDASMNFNIASWRSRVFPKLFPIGPFSGDLSKICYSGKTVIYSCIEIAAYMGFSEIVLLGVDCNYENGKTHSEIMRYDIDEKGLQMVVNSSGQLMRIQLNSLAKSISNKDFKVYNASRGGKLECFERRSLEDILR